MSGSVSSCDAQRIQQLMQAFDLGPTESIGLMFAKLQLSQAQICKEKAKTLMGQISDIQANQKKCAEMIALCRKLQQEGKENKWQGKPSVVATNKQAVAHCVARPCVRMPKELIEYLDKNKIPYPNSGNDYILGDKDWDFVIQGLTNFQESISNGTQTLLMQVQDFIGQYNSYESGASSAIDKANQLTQTLVQK